jgi:hypothetical protein
LVPVAARKDVFWVNSFIPGKSCLKLKNAWVEVTAAAMIPVYSYYKKNLPGFENSYIYDSASQTGTRGSRRLIGEYVLTGEEARSGKQFDDTVLIFPQGVPLKWPGGSEPTNVGMPYRCLVPIKLEGLLAAGRCFSSDKPLIRCSTSSHCIQMGQAAGTAAALTVKSKVLRGKLISGASEKAYRAGRQDCP